MENGKLIILGTSIDSSDKEKEVLALLTDFEEIAEVSVDMEDWEHVLCITCNKPISINKLMKSIQSLGILCYELADN